ncbi:MULTISPECIES: hypothetical protein [unclassified Microbacterium]|uniref:hypothetical protein n=1 Tax=unclassified Microbacterium TaxID=2609290 RepID=UPI00200423F5|nr:MULTISPECIES: hypothetical protein [unclassified Microbacterium]
MTERPARTSRAARIALTVAMTGGLIGSLAVSPAYAVSENPELFCDLPGQELAISPVADLQDGEQVTWQSAVKGTAPTTFTGEYVGKLDNGLGADADGNPRDLLLVKLDGDVVNGSAGSLAAGVWAGASGSPVYDADGALIGAVSYGFSFLPDNVAGVTPAAYMKTIGKLPASKTLSGTAKQQVARMADETATGRTSTLRRIEPVRVTVGATAAELDGVNADLAQRVKGFRGAAASGRAVPGGDSLSSDFPIVTGGNIAVSYAYGAVTEASVGTVTAICGDEVFAFGHPGSWNSKLSASIHGASAARIVPDLTGAYKMVSAIGKVKGTLVDDRLAGVRAVLGDGPATVPVRTTGIVGDHESTSVTRVSEKQLIAAAVYTQVGNEATRMLDNGREGSARLGWSISYVREDGRTGTLSNQDRYADPNDLPGIVGMGVADDVAMLQGNPFDDVRITAVSVRARFVEGYRAARLAGVQMWKNGAWSTVTPGSTTKVARGKAYDFRAVLAPLPGTERVTEYSPFTVTVPKSLQKGYRVILSAPTGEEEEYPAPPRDFAEYLAVLDDNARSDVMTRSIIYHPVRGARVSRSASVSLPTVIQPDGKTVMFRLEAPALKR